MNNIAFEIIDKIFTDINKCNLDQNLLSKLNNIKTGEFQLDLDYEDDGSDIYYMINLYEIDNCGNNIILSSEKYPKWIENILNNLNVEHDYNQLCVETADQLNYLIRLAQRIIA